MITFTYSANEQSTNVIVLGHFLRHFQPRTYWEEVPCDRRCGEASEHIVRAAEMSEVGAGHGLTSALTPH